MTAYFIALVIGFVAGLRSMVPLAMLRAARHDWTSILFAVFALGEIIADKLPGTPARTSIGPLAGRVIIGAYAGSVVCVVQGGALIGGIILGAAGALAGTYGGYAYRTRFAGVLPDIALALIEDAVALVLGFLCGYRASIAP